MFAPKVTKRQTKGADSTNSLSRQRPTSVAQPFRSRETEQARILQRTIGNQATLRYPPEAAKVTAEAPRAAWDFSKIPIFPPGQSTRLQTSSALRTFPLPGILQRKLLIGEVNDPLEYEADRVAERVMRMPEPGAAKSPAVSGTPPEMQRKCACGGTCADCQIEQSGEPEQLQMKSVDSSSLGQTAAPPMVHEVLNSPGQPLDAATRAYFEPRFGQDFSRVRVHSDVAAEHSARDVNASAYTVGHKIVFGAGRFAPRTDQGRQLIAHELAHVLQQSGGNDTPSSLPAKDRRTQDLTLSSLGSKVLQRSPGTSKQASRQEWLKELGNDPQEAHLAWKKVSPEERFVVLGEMALRFGSPFAEQFLEEVKKGKPQLGETFYGSGMGPTPAQLVASGYRLGGMFRTGAADIDVQVWFHPSGKKIRRDVSGRKPTPMPPIVDCGPLEEVTSEMLRDTIPTETAAQDDLVAEKDRLEKMNKTDDAYGDQYDEYIKSLQTMNDRLKGEIDDIEALQQQLVDMNCNVSTIDPQLQDLRDVQIWADMELSPMSTQFLEPIRVKLKDP